MFWGIWGLSAAWGVFDGSCYCFSSFFGFKFMQIWMRRTYFDLLFLQNFCCSVAKCTKLLWNVGTLPLRLLYKVLSFSVFHLYLCKLSGWWLFFAKFRFHCYRNAPPFQGVLDDSARGFSIMFPVLFLVHFFCICLTGHFLTIHSRIVYPFFRKFREQRCQVFLRGGGASYPLLGGCLMTSILFTNSPIPSMPIV